MAATDHSSSTAVTPPPIVNSCKYFVTKLTAKPHVPVIGNAPGASARRGAVVGSGTVTVVGNVSCARPMARIKLKTLVCSSPKACSWRLQNETTFADLPASGTISLRISVPPLLGTHSYRVEIEEHHVELGVFINTDGKRVSQLRTTSNFFASSAANLTG